MTLFAQLALGVLVLGGVGFGAWNYSHTQREAREREEQSKANLSADVQLSTGMTNTDLDADLKAIDGELTIINNTSTEVDSNETPVLE